MGGVTRDIPWPDLRAGASALKRPPADDDTAIDSYYTDAVTTVDWARREPVRARLRVIVTDMLEDYGHPPDLSQVAAKNVLELAEVLSLRWAS